MKELKYRMLKDTLFKGLVILSAVLITLPLFLIIYHITKAGFSSINWEFLTQLPKPMGEKGGGILNGLLGSFMLISLSSLLAIPFGILTGIYLSEFGNTKMAYWVRFFIDILQGIPSIVIGIIAYIWVVKTMHTFSALSGSIALSIMMLPVIVRSTEESLKLIPLALKEASLSLGVSYFRTIFKIVLPCSVSGILTGVVLSIARIAGETAPLLFTAFGNPFLNSNILKPVQSLPLMIFNYATSPFPEENNMAWGISFILCFFILSLNLIAKGVAKKWKVQF